MKKYLYLFGVFLIFPMIFFGGFIQAEEIQEQIEIPGLLHPDEVKAISCGTGEKVRDHMQEMGDLITDLGHHVDALLDPETELEEYKEIKKQIITQSQRLRVHLAAVLVKNPPKLLMIDSDNPARAKLIFQEYLIMVIKQTIAIEKELREDYDEAVQIREQNIKTGSLLVELNEIVSNAHSIFR